MKEYTLFFLLVLAMFLWGSSWASSKILISYTSADIVTLWRFFFVFIGSIFLAFIFKIKLRIDRHIFKWVLLAGIFNSLYVLLLFTALNYGASGRGGVIVNTMIPIFSYLFFIFHVKLIKKEKIELKKSEIFGLCLGLISGLFLFDISKFNELFGPFNMLFLCCALIWSGGTILTYKTNSTNALSVNFYVNLISFLIFSPLLFKVQSYEIFSYDFKFWLAMFTLAFLSTIIGTSIYYYGVHKLGSKKANSFVLITPISALLISFIVLNEVPSTSTIIGCFFAILAIYFINIFSKKIKH
ncbi:MULTISPECIES: DMT family transporter [unclassified Campylobacter]|uniref:DMT family transporter n=1 Tax=unclassified Campylobacter TaxID=2593542 RepID=UPI001237A4AF|nr:MULTISPECIES: DMT family transporter [unclassified Campylobacter]KAA6227188.1 DMT family transporter [Campylobacter sp. LR286c]KAA6227938.1 DMT family transporter [Campylobacter sp. LR185c]KAA6228347.1 DMT family transporter [Campylobacter sp. LR196d]KAA6229348.1 DMT family transporter [Campylobacter sp. LR291e]KAA8604374.1 hypothetical protein CGP82_02295 [Campylobacter sp. LR185c]